MLFIVENRSVVIEKLGSEAQKRSYLWLRLISIHPIEQERKAAAEGDCARYLLHLFHVFRFDPLFILLSSYASLHCSLLVAVFFLRRVDHFEEPLHLRRLKVIDGPVSNVW